MKKYNATLLYVGDVERETYNVSLPSTGLEPVYSGQGTDIYRIAGDAHGPDMRGTGRVCRRRSQTFISPPDEMIWLHHC